MDASKVYGACAFLAGLGITLFLAAYLTPREWWRRPNLRALLILVAGAWGFGSTLLWLAPAIAGAAKTAQAASAGDAAQLSTAQPATRPAAVSDERPAGPPFAAKGDSDGPLIAGQPFIVHRDLNLRAAPGVHAARLLTVPAGATVTPTGARHGDWWQISASVAGRDSIGWASSLWLRRSGE